MIGNVLLNGNGVMELNTRELAAGIYHLSIPGTTMSTKLNVQR